MSGVSYLQTAEASVYAAIDTSYNYGSVLSPSEIGNELALEYVNIVFARDKVYTTSFVSAFDELSEADFYAYSGILILLMFSGICFNHMYEVNNRAVDSKMRIAGLGPVKLGIIKILIMLHRYIFWEWCC